MGISTKLGIFALVLMILISFVSLINAQEGEKIYVTDDFTSQKIEASQYFEKWFDEYVRWIITPEEKDEFEALETVQEKMDFIKLFWLKRDPEPDTILNEFKETYYERLRYIQSNFSYSDTPGIESHRGMVYAVLGEPDYEDKHYSIDASVARMLRKGQITAARGLLWCYGAQPGARIPNYYCVVFMKFGANRYEIVADAYSNPTLKDSMIDRGSVGYKGFIPSRLNDILKSKQEYFIKNQDLTLKDSAEEKIITSTSEGNVQCALKKAEDKVNWGIVECSIPYTNLVFRSIDNINHLVLTGNIVVQNLKDETSVSYPFKSLELKLTDDELKANFDEKVILKSIITKAPEKTGKHKISVEIQDKESGIVYSSQVEVDK